MACMLSRAWSSSTSSGSRNRRSSRRRHGHTISIRGGTHGSHGRQRHHWGCACAAAAHHTPLPSARPRRRDQRRIRRNSGTRRRPGRWRRRTIFTIALMPIASISTNKRPATIVTAEFFTRRTKPQRNQPTRIATDHLLRIAMDAWFRLVLVNARHMPLKVMLAAKRASAFRFATRIRTCKGFGSIRIRIVRREMRVKVVSPSKGLVALGAWESFDRSRTRLAGCCCCCWRGHSGRSWREWTAVANDAAAVAAAGCAVACV